MVVHSFRAPASYFGWENGVLKYVENRALQKREIHVYQPQPGRIKPSTPVLYFLHGGCNCEKSVRQLLDWLEANHAPFALVVPPGKYWHNACTANMRETAWGTSFVMRSDGLSANATKQGPLGKQLSWDSGAYVAEVVVPLVEGEKGAAARPRGLRAIAGFSDGGRGAAFLATRYPSMFGGVVSFFAWYRDFTAGSKKCAPHQPYGALLGAAPYPRALLLAEDTARFAETARENAARAGCPADRIQCVFHKGEHSVAHVVDVFPTHVLPFLRDTLQWRCG